VGQGRGSPGTSSDGSMYSDVNSENGHGGVSYSDRQSSSADNPAESPVLDWRAQSQPFWSPDSHTLGPGSSSTKGSVASGGPATGSGGRCLTRALSSAGFRWALVSSLLEALKVLPSVAEAVGSPTVCRSPRSKTGEHGSLVSMVPPTTMHCGGGTSEEQGASAAARLTDPGHAWPVQTDSERCLNCAPSTPCPVWQRSQRHSFPHCPVCAWQSCGDSASPVAVAPEVPHGKPLEGRGHREGPGKGGPCLRRRGRSRSRPGGAAPEGVGRG